MKRHGKILLQLIVSVTLLIWLFGNQDLRAQIAPALAQADSRWLWAAFGVYGLVELLGAIRWQFLLRAFGFRLAWPEATRILLIGIFFNTLLPGLIAGDALRALYLSRRFEHKSAEALLVVLVERLFGLLGLIGLGASLMVGRYRWLHLSEMTGRFTDLALFLVAMGALGMLAPLFLRRIAAGRFLPDLWRRHLASLRLLAHSPRVLLVAGMTTMAAHLCYAASFYFTGGAFAAAGPTASAVDMLTITPIVNTFTSLPISLSGVGVRESLLQIFLGGLSGVPEGVAVLIGTLGFLIRGLWAVLGMAFLICGRQLHWDEWTVQLFGKREAEAGKGPSEGKPHFENLPNCPYTAPVRERSWRDW